MTNNLPPLPPWMERSSDLLKDDFRAYGQQCRQQALEEAAEVCDEHARLHKPASENADIYRAQAHWAAHIARAIRALKEKP